MNHYLIELMSDNTCEEWLSPQHIATQHISANNMEEAKEKFIANGQGKYLEDYLFTYLYDEYGVERITIYEVRNAETIDMLHMMQQEQEQQEQENQQEQEEKERQEYKRLKAKYEQQ